MRHLTGEEIGRLSLGESTPPSRRVAAHLVSCARCREGVDALRSLVARLEGLGRLAPQPGFAAEVMRRIDLMESALSRKLARLPALEPSPALLRRVLSQIDLPDPALERALERLRRWTPTPGFSSGVLARVRLPVPWPARILRFVRRRRVALAAASATSLGVTGVAAAWLFGMQGMTPGYLVALAVGGVETMLVDAMVGAGRVGYRLGLVDAGGSIFDRFGIPAALASLGLASLIGLLSLWVAASLMRRPARQPITLRRAA